MAPLHRWQKALLGVVGVLVFAILVVVFIFTQTDYGRSRTSGLALKQIAGSVHGIVRMGKVHGNLLTGARIDGLVITDSAGKPFLKADTAVIHYSVRSFVRRRIFLHDVRLVRPIIVLDQAPRGQWNYQRLFPTDTLKNDSIRGFGSWIRIDRLTMVGGDITVNRSWSPPSTMQGSERAAVIARALSTDNRDLIVRRDSGFQALSTFKEVTGFFPLVIGADPDSSVRIVNVGKLSMKAKLFRYPPADVRDVQANVAVGADTVVFRNAVITLPGSKLTASGIYSIRTTNVNARVHAAPVTFSDLRFAMTNLPDGSGTLDLAIARVGDIQRMVATNMNVRAEGSHITGAIDLDRDVGIRRINSSDLAFTGVDTRLIKKMAPGTNVPIEGVLDGHLKLAGNADALNVDGWTNIHDRNGQTSRITADGMIGNQAGGVIAKNLQLHFDPIRVSLLRTVRPDLPIGGDITGRALVNGNLSSRFSVDADVIHTDRETGRSHIVAVGDLSASGDFTTRGLRMQFQPVQAALLRAFQPNLDLQGDITGRARLVGGLISGFQVDADVVHSSRSTGRSHVLANGGINVHNGFKARRLHLRFDPLQVAFVRSFQPALKMGGTLNGSATITGAMASGFIIDADIVHNDATTGRSHVLAVGEVKTANGFTARNLKLRFESLQVALLKTFQPSLPIDGTIDGRATINGSPSRRIIANFDVEHDGSTGVSIIAGDADVTFARGEIQFVDVNTRARPLSLATAGLFAPAAGLRGEGIGSIIARGNRDNIQFTTDLTIPGNGALAARGSLALGTVMRYDINSTMSNFNPSAISTRAPSGLLTGTIIANGRGTDPATAVASVDVALFDSRLAGAPGTDSTRLVAHVANGLATIDRGRIRLASATADIDGTFGLVATQNGTLNYNLVIDTLSRVAEFARGDTTFVYPRPLQNARRMAQAKADSIRIARETEVERAATGSPPEPNLVVDSVQPLKVDSVAGSVKAQGTLTGNIKRFGAIGTATLKEVLFRGNQVQSGNVAYKIANAPSTTEMDANIQANLAGVRAGGFGFDSARVAVNNRGGVREGNGDFDLAIFQDPGREYRVKSDFVLALDRKELKLADLLLRFDSTVWRGTRAGAVSWASSGIELRTIDLRNEKGGHIFANGTLDKEGSSDLQLGIDSLQIGDIAALLQDTLNTRGILTLHTRVQGTAAAPLMAGTLAIDSVTRGGIRLPDIRTAFDYKNRELTADAQLTRGLQILLSADAKVPVDLAFTGRTGGSRMLDAPLAINAHMDSLPLDALPSFSTALDEMRGVVRGDVAVRGTFKDPLLTGNANLSVASVRIVEPGLILTDGAGSFIFKDKQVLIDSLVAQSAGGPVRISGAIDAKELTKPAFDLKVAALNAQVLNNEKWGNVKANVDIDVKGPLDRVVATGTVAVLSGVINAPEQGVARRATNLDDPTLSNVLDTLDAPIQYRRGQSTLMRNLQMDVQLTIARDTWVRNHTLNVEVYTPDDVDPLHVRADNANQVLTLDGTINADRGEYSIAGRQFKLTTGSATFLGTPTLDPLLQLSAQYDVPRPNREALTILINIGGYLRSPRLTLSSNAQPPLPQSDLIGYLAFGRTSSSLLSPEASGLAGGGLGLIAQQQLAGLGLGAFTDVLVHSIENQGSRVGLDVFRVHPAVLPDELSFGGYFQNFLRGTEFEAGKYINRRLFAALQGRASGTLPGLRLEYESRGGFSWLATLDTRYRPQTPSFAELNAASTAPSQRVLGAFFFWTRRF